MQFASVSILLQFQSCCAVMSWHLSDRRVFYMFIGFLFSFNFTSTDPSGFFEHHCFFNYSDPCLKEDVNKRAFEKLRKETSEKLAVQPVGGVSLRDDGFNFSYFFYQTYFFLLCHLLDIDCHIC